jgi:hypothetical protein
MQCTELSRTKLKIGGTTKIAKPIEQQKGFYG